MSSLLPLLALLPLPLEIKYSARSRSIRLKLLDHKIIVSGPPHVSEAKLFAFVEEKKSWINAHVTQKKQRDLHYPLAWPQNLEPLVSLPFLGKQLVFGFSQISEKPLLFFEETQILLTHFMPFNPKLAADALIQGYLKQATDLVNQFCAHYCPQIGLWPSGLKVKYQKSLYGSLGSNNTLHLNWLLITAPLFVFEYVVVHELSHLKHRNHGPRFWAQVAKLMPNYTEAENWLRQWGPCFKLPPFMQEN